MGAMDDIRLYSRALTATKISALATVAPPNTAPVATNGTLGVSQDTPASGTLQATDADNNPLTYSIVANGTKHNCRGDQPSTGAYTYTPNAGATGADSFTFKANDGTANSNTATVNVTIAATPSTFIGHWRADGKDPARLAGDRQRRDALGQPDLGPWPDRVERHQVRWDRRSRDRRRERRPGHDERDHDGDVDPS